jgi:hypothetical protein
LPLGFNWSIPKITQGAGATGSITAYGCLGAQVGVGYIWIKEFSTELMAKTYCVSMKASSDTTLVDYHEAYMSGAQFNFKYNF